MAVRSYPIRYANFRVKRRATGCFVLSRVIEAMRRAGISQPVINAFTQEAASSHPDQLRTVRARWVRVQ
jgi:hypothetical protein